MANSLLYIAVGHFNLIGIITELGYGEKYNVVNDNVDLTIDCVEVTYIDFGYQ